MSLKAYVTLYSFLCLSLRDATPGNKDAATFPRYRTEYMHSELVAVALKSRFECGQEGKATMPQSTPQVSTTHERESKI